MNPRVAVIGGGISGLAAAYRLRRELGPSATITVCEATDRLGGKLRTSELAGQPVDVGAEAFLARRPEATELAGELDLDPLLRNPTAARAMIRAGGHALRLPRRTMMGVPAARDAVAEVLSAQGGRWAAAEADLPALVLPEGDVALGPLLRERFGDELVDRLVDPLLSGVYAGGADGLGLRATMPALARALDEGAGSLTAAAASLLPDVPGTAPVFATLDGGLRKLVDRLAERSVAEVRTGQPARELRRLPGNRWRVRFGAAAAAHAPADAEFDVDAVLIALPAPAASKLLTGALPAAAAAFGELELASMAVVSLALPPGTELPDASGVLIGAAERRADGVPFTTKAFTFTSAKWAHQGEVGAPVLLRGSVGRFGEPGPLRASDDELLRLVRADLAELAGVTTEPIDAVVTRWGGGLPQYAPGHLERVQRIGRAAADLPGLEIAGASLHGVGIPACIATANGVAHRLAGSLLAHTSAGAESGHGR